MNPFWSRDRIDAAFAAIRDRATLEAALVRAATPVAAWPGHHGCPARARRAGRRGRAAGAERDADLARWLVHEVASFEYYTFAAVCGAGVLRHRPEHRAAPARARAAGRVRPCSPACNAPTAARRWAQAESALRCTGCGGTFLTEYGVPILYPKHPHDDPAEQADAVRRLCGNDNARAAIGTPRDGTTAAQRIAARRAQAHRLASGARPGLALPPARPVARRPMIPGPLRRLLREPLVQFSLLGGALFCLHGLLGSRDECSAGPYRGDRRADRASGDDLRAHLAAAAHGARAAGPDRRLRS